MKCIIKDILGRIYEYFLGQFASNELQKGGEFYTPACLVRTMVEILEPPFRLGFSFSISSNASSIICPILLSFEMELTEMYIEAGYPYDNFFWKN